MKIAGSHRFEAPRADVFSALLDPEVLSKTLPGFQRLERVEENQFQGALNIRVGPVQGQFQGKLELSEVEPPDGYRLKMTGQGAPGFVQGEGAIRLEDDAGGTRLDYDVEAQVGGRIAGVGQRLLDSSAKVLTRQALEGLEAQITARQAPKKPPEEGAEAAPAPSAAPPAAPTQAQFAARMARGMFEDLVPARRRPLVYTVLLAIYTALVVALTRACSG